MDVAEPGGVTVHVSHTFDLTFKANDILPNAIIFSQDDTFFLVHCHKLIAASNNNFGSLISPEYATVCDDPDLNAIELCLPESASVLNVLLCAIYGLPCDINRPTFQCLLDALVAMKKYGLTLENYLLPGLPIYNAILNHTPFHPFEVYAIAAENDLTDLAMVSSSYTLTRSIATISFDLVRKIGSGYLHRLYQLHAFRLETLKAMFNVTLWPHALRPYCSPRTRFVTSRAFHLACMQIFYDATPGRSTSQA